MGEISKNNSVEQNMGAFDVDQNATNQETRKRVKRPSGKKVPKKRKYPLHLQALLAYQEFCEMPKGDEDTDLSDEGALILQDEQAREDFFNALYPPTISEKGSLPGYTKAITKSLLRVIWVVVGFFVAIIIVGGFEIGYKEIDYEPNATEAIYIQDALRTRKQLTQAEINKRRKQAKIDFAEKQQKDSTFFADYYVFSGWYEIDEETETFWGQESALQALSDAPKQAKEIKLAGFKKDYTSIIALLLLLFPIVFWIIRTIVRFATCANKRAKVKAQNTSAAADYQSELEAFNNRPTIFDYMYFCQGVVGPNDDRHVSYGDAIEMAIEQSSLKKEDLKSVVGKIFLTAFFFDVDSDGVETDNPFITLQRMGINVAMAMPDRIVLLQGIWETFTDNKPKFTEKALMYSQINDITKEEEAIVLHHGGNETVLATSWGRWESLWKYQDDDPSETYTYSDTRTTDPDEFYRTLVEMQGRYYHRY